MLDPGMIAIAARLAELPPLGKGGHKSGVSGASVLEAASYAGEEIWSDAPKCVSPVISSFLRVWSNDLPDADRDRLLRPLIPTIIGTHGTQEVEQRRAMLAVDWLIRECTPAWLRVAEMPEHADALAGLPEISDMVPSPAMVLELDEAVIEAEAVRRPDGRAGRRIGTR